MKQIIINKVIFYNLEKLENKTEIFHNKIIQNIKYAFLLTDGLEAVAIKLNNKFITEAYSKFILEEEDEILEIASLQEINKIDFKIIKEHSKNNFITKNDLSKKKYLIKSLHEIKNNKEKLKYLYFDYFDQLIEDEVIMFNKLKEEINNNFYNCKDKIYDFFKLISIKNV